ncbi:hypothetical protein Scep_019572 [Stephania cephalantha]|uniref:Uncharacterized protein n=1 Tax=Stephania cephalantha TaxID=152367 RepID=A0AAP0IBG2_9MAGN
MLSFIDSFAAFLCSSIQRAYAQSLINIVLSLKCRNVETIVQWSPYSSEDELLDQMK